MKATVTTLSLAILRHRPMRTAVTAAGVAVAFFLTCAQFGLLVGWCHTLTALIRHAGADLWFMAERTPAYDYGTAIPRTRLHQVRSLPGVASAEPLVMAWNIWQRPDGRRVNVELVGLDAKLMGGPWAMERGRLDCVRTPNTVVVDELFLGALGVTNLGDTVEMMGLRATVGGISRRVRTFTASPFVFARIDDAIRYDKRYASDEITYVMATLEPGADAAAVKARAVAAVPHAECLTSREFQVRSITYWMLETGVGITVVLTAFLGLAVGTVIVSQTLYAATQENLPHFATLLALGFPLRTLVSVVLVNAAAVGGAGMLAGGALFGLAMLASARTPIPLETTPAIAAGLVAVQLLSCLLASVLSINLLRRTDPITVFGQ